MSESSQCKIVGLSGGVACGKTTLANYLASSNPTHISVLSQDSYYMPHDDIDIQSRSSLNFDIPEELDAELLKQHLLTFKSGRSIEVPTYSYELCTRLTQTRSFFPTDVVILEGHLVLNIADIQDYIDYSIFIDLSDSKRLERRIERDTTQLERTVERILSQTLNVTDKMYHLYTEKAKEFADIVLDGNESLSYNADVLYKLCPYFKRLVI